MTPEKTTMVPEGTTRAFGWRVYGVGMMALAVVALVWKDFDLGQPVPRAFPHRTALAYAADVFMLIAAAAVGLPSSRWHRARAWGAAALTAYYALIVVILMNGRLLLTGYSEYGTYDGIAEQLALAAGALAVYATAGRGRRGGVNLESGLSARLTRLGQLAFGVCALIFGGAHFVYMNLTAPLVPKWLPPSQVFWGYATGVAFIAAGLALLTGVQARLAAILLTVMLAIFGLLANGPVLLADHASHFNWAESALNLTLVGAAWVVADSLAQPNPRD
ncbi:MAG TPA: hypothetical protein VGD64_11095 [Acidisarcina sp.]